MTEERRPGAAKVWFQAALIALLATEAVLDDAWPWWAQALAGLLGLWSVTGLVRTAVRRPRTRARARA